MIFKPSLSLRLYFKGKFLLRQVISFSSENLFVCFIKYKPIINKKTVTNFLVRLILKLAFLNGNILIDIVLMILKIVLLTDDYLFTSLVYLLTDAHSGYLENH